MDLQVGQTLGDYEILRVLGAGGMGKVYQVRNTITNRVEAMKVLLPDVSAEAELGERFLREIRISASLDHPNIAALRTAQRVDNRLLMIMEFVEGSTIDSIMHAGHVPLDKGLGYTAQALSALSYAHSRGVIHRDIKPANIMLTPQNIVKLMDFGIAKVATDKKLTKTGLMVGSVYYMSPEQIEGRDLDARSDIYSLGVTLYEIVTGKRPFNGDSEYQIMAAHLKGAPPPPRDLDNTLPAELNEIIMMALAKDPAQRFQSADAFRAALSSIHVKSLAPMATTASIIAPATAPPLAQATGPAPKKDRRLLYMVAGSLATVAVIVAAAVEIPKYWHTSAGAPATAPALQQSAAPQVVPPPAASPSVETPPAAPQPAPDQVSTPANSQVPTVLKAMPPAKPNAPITQARPPASRPPVASTVQEAPPPSQAAPQQQPPAQTAAVPVDSAELSELRDRLSLMSARVGAVGASLQNLQREQARQGLGLRSDMVAAQQRLNIHLGEAESSLSQGNAANAKKKLDAAELELERLEKFLGK